MLLALEWPDAALPRRSTDGRSPRRYLISPVLMRQENASPGRSPLPPLLSGPLRRSNGHAAGWCFLLVEIRAPGVRR